MKAITAEKISFGYTQELILEEFFLAIESGEFLGIIGPNGSGKSTLLRLLAGVRKPQRGVVKVMEKELNHLSRREIARTIAFVPQESFFAFEWTVQEVVMMGRNPYLKLLERPRPEDLKKVTEAMRLTGVEMLAGQNINSISAGEKQRVLLARALAQEPEILLLDEATAHLDLVHQVMILQILKTLNEQGKTIVLVSHDLNEAAVCSRLLLLAKGKPVACDVPEKVLTPDLIHAAYGLEPVVTKHPFTGRPQVLLPPV
ncbi:ABC transporter ATP-binding protein [candidate division WOR-3 bacterium]|nr:ABC transporter ATP-binding protein [candidate division WOR-3 bacterium]